MRLLLSVLLIAALWLVIGWALQSNAPVPGLHAAMPSQAPCLVSLDNVTVGSTGIRPCTICSCRFMPVTCWRWSVPTGPANPPS